MSTGAAHDRIAAQPWFSIGLVCWGLGPLIDRLAPPLPLGRYDLRDVALWVLFGVGTVLLLASLRAASRLKGSGRS
jgi:hypothetical protein